MSCTQLGITAWQHSLAARPVCCECAMAALQRCVRVGGAAAAHASVEPIALREDDGSRMCDRVWPVIAFARDRSASSEPRCQHELWRWPAVDVRCTELLPCVANTRKSDEVVRMASLTLTCVSSPTRSIGVRCSERDERAVASAAAVAAPAATMKASLADAIIFWPTSTYAEPQDDEETHSIILSCDGPATSSKFATSARSLPDAPHCIQLL